MPPKRAKRQKVRERQEHVRIAATPAEPFGSDAAYPDDEEEAEIEVKAGAMEPSSDPIIEEDASGVQLAPDLEDAQQNTTSATTGANQSQEEVGRNLRSAVQQLQGQNTGGSANMQSSAGGKLKKPSSKAKGMTMKRLGPARDPFASVYKLQASPEKPVLPPNRVWEKASFSPTKKQLKAQRVQRQAQPYPGLRRSKRGQAEDNVEIEVEIARSRPPIVVGQQQAPVEEDEAADNVYRDRFPDHVVRRHHPAEIDVEGGPDDQQIAHADIAAEHVQYAANSVQPTVDGLQAKERGRGRPKKHVNQSNDESAPQQRKASRAEQLDSSSHVTLKQPDHQTSQAVQTRMSIPPTPNVRRSESKLTALRMQHESADASKPGIGQRLQVKQSEVSTSGGIAIDNIPEQQESAASAPPAARPNKSSRGSKSKEQAPAERPPARRSSRHQQALADLERRRNAPDDYNAGGSHQADDAAAEPADFQQEDLQQEGATESEDELPKRPVTLRPSEVRFSGIKGVADQSEASEDEAPEASTTQSRRKRKAASQPNKANTAAKRRKQVNPADDEYNDHDEDDENEANNDRQASEARKKANRRRLCGQWIPLKTIHRDLRLVGCNTEAGELLDQNDIDLEDADVKTVVGLCTEAMERYHRLANGDSEDSEPAVVLEDIARRVDGLRGHHEDLPTDFNDRTKTTNIYSHLIPALVKLVWQAVSCYEIIDEDDTLMGQISMPHLQIVHNLVTLTLEMERSAMESYKARPDTENAVVKPVHNHIAVPLREVAKAFQTILQRHRYNERQIRRREREAQDRGLQLEQEERRNRQAARLNRTRKKWEGLHNLRQLVEQKGGLTRPEKMSRLQMPDPKLDDDSNGVTFRRVSLFHRRVGPPPGLLHKAKQVEWTQDQLDALTQGLQAFAGDNVYENIIRTLCPKGKILNKYTVLEIVATAEVTKTYFEQQMGDATEDWVKAIPVWSNSHAGGEENEDSFVDVDEVADEDGEAFAADA